MCYTHTIYNLGIDNQYKTLKVTMTATTSTTDEREYEPIPKKPFSWDKFFRETCVYTVMTACLVFGAAQLLELAVLQIIDLIRSF